MFFKNILVKFGCGDGGDRDGRTGCFILLAAGGSFTYQGV